MKTENFPPGKWGQGRHREKRTGNQVPEAVPDWQWEWGCSPARQGLRVPSVTPCPHRYLGGSYLIRSGVIVGGRGKSRALSERVGLNLTWSHLPVLKLQASYLTSLSLSSLICNTRRTIAISRGYWAGITAPTTQGYHEDVGVKGQGCTRMYKFKYLSPHMVTIIFLAMRTFKIYSLSNCQICNTVMLSTVTVLYTVWKEEKSQQKNTFRKYL